MSEITIHDKLRELINSLGLNNNSFARKIGVTSTTIDSITTGRLQPDGSRKKTKPGFDLLQRIIDECQINPDYFFGIGGNLEPESINKAVDKFEMPKVISVNREGDENVIFVPVKARAGYLNGYGDKNYIESLPAFSMPYLQNGSFRCFEIEGSSMVRTLYDGDLVFGRFVESLDEIKDGRIHIVVSRNDGIVIKRVINRVKESGKLILKSDNRDGNYPTYTIDADNVEEIWYASMFASKQMPEPIDIYERLQNVESKLIEMEYFLQEKNILRK